jgi:regulator of protease activity HflC (stomatin/prohibitin superfamily)
MFSRKPATEPDIAFDGEDDDDFDSASTWMPDWLRRWLKRSGLYLLIGLLLAAFLMLALPSRVFYAIEPGMRGVRWSMFGGGTVLDRDYPEGLRVIAPWDRMFIYDVRVQEINGEVVVLSANGLPITVNYSVRFRPDLSKLPYLHQTYGPNYVETLVRPEIVSALREVIGNYRPETIYSRSELGLIDETYQSLAAQLTNRYVVVQTVIISGLRLTPELESAINQKLVDEQTALAYEFRLSREQSEAQRKAIEAQGIKTFESVSGISILKWRGIEATEALANSPNAKIIVIGPGTNQLPVILGGGPGGD